MTDRRAAATPSTVATVLGVVAFATGATKRWVLSPVGDAFGDLSPNGKVLVTAVVVIGIIGLLAFARVQHRSAVRATREMIESTMQRPQGANSVRSRAHCSNSSSKRRRWTTLSRRF